jgi:hypothetical protein
MLIMLLVGQEGTLGATQAIGGVFSAFLMYTVGRIAAPRHRIVVFTAGLLLFFFGAVTNTVLFNAVGVLIFIACLIVAKPLLDLAYYPIELMPSPGWRIAPNTPTSSTTNSDCLQAACWVAVYSWPSLTGGLETRLSNTHCQRLRWCSCCLSG